MTIRDDRDEAKPRMCLRCRLPFLSEHAGNRICTHCLQQPVANCGLRRVSLDIESLTSEKSINDDIVRQTE